MMISKTARNAGVKLLGMTHRNPNAVKLDGDTLQDIGNDNNLKGEIMEISIICESCGTELAHQLVGNDELEIEPCEECLSNARDDGYSEGHAGGMETGYEEGYDEGDAAGFDRCESEREIEEADNEEEKGT